jgi:hypothetical protein
MGLTSPGFCSNVAALFIGIADHEHDGKEKSTESGQPAGVIVPLSSMDGIKPITRRF